jgi:hypothetical protein
VSPQLLRQFDQYASQDISRDQKGSGQEVLKDEGKEGVRNQRIRTGEETV